MRLSLAEVTKLPFLSASVTNGTELPNLERSIVLGHALLLVNHWPLAIQLDPNAQDEKDRRG